MKKSLTFQLLLDEINNPTVNAEQYLKYALYFIKNRGKHRLGEIIGNLNYIFPTISDQLANLDLIDNGRKISSYQLHLNAQYFIDGNLLLSKHPGSARLDISTSNAKKHLVLLSDSPYPRTNKIAIADAVKGTLSLK